MNRKMILWIIGSAIFLTILLLVVVVENSGFSAVKTFDTKGELIVHREPQVPWEEITDFAVSQGKIFLFYEDKGMVNVYSFEGEFLKGFQICTIKNSHGNITVAEGLVLVESRLPVIYAFDPVTLELKYYVTGGHDGWERQTEEYKEYKRLQVYFDREPVHSDGDWSFILSDNGRDILVSESDSRFQSVGFLPKRSDLIESLAVLLVVLILGFTHAIEPYPIRKK